MLSSRHLRLYAYIALMLGMIAVGSFARMRWGVPEAPYGERAYGEPWFGLGIIRRGTGWRAYGPRIPDPFWELQQVWFPVSPVEFEKQQKVDYGRGLR